MTPKNARATASYGLTKFSDLSPEEFKQKYLLRSGSAGNVVHAEDVSTVLKLSASSHTFPDKLDWYESKRRVSCGPVVENLAWYYFPE
jgi:hypothetical protein